METIIIQTKNEKEFAFVSEFLERTKIKATVKKDKVIKPREKSKAAILDSIEKGYREAQLHAAGKIKLQTAQELYDEL